MEEKRTDNLRELQLLELTVLKQIAALCKEHGLRYYLLGGTFLGAVRHQGFIPWDDDIDVGMPREDFEIFCRLAEKEFQFPYGFSSFHNNAEHIYFHPRVYRYDSRVIDRSGVKEKETYAWVDIFPLDGMPENAFYRKCHEGYLLFLRMLFMFSQFDQIVNVNREGRPWYEKILVSIGKKIKFDRLLSAKKRMEKIERTMKKFPYEGSAYVGNFMGAYKMKEIFPKCYYDETDEYLFEDMMCPAPKNYDAVLKQMYGDYMTPPKEERKNKHYTEVISANSEEK